MHERSHIHSLIQILRIDIAFLTVMMSTTAENIVTPLKPLCDNSIESILEKAKLLPNTKGGWAVHDALIHLIASDVRFLDVIQYHGIPLIYDTTQEITESAYSYIQNMETSFFHTLLKTIVYQQLHGNAAQVIFDRLYTALGVKKGEVIEPHHVINSEIKIIYVEGKKKITVNGEISGLSESKSKYILDLAEHFDNDQKLKGVDLNTLIDEELYKKLVDVKGLGPWSVHMFMIFNLQRANVLAPGDLAIRKGMCTFFNHPSTYFESARKRKEMASTCSAWAPYSSMGCWYMWRLAGQSSAIEKEKLSKNKVSPLSAVQKKSKKIMS
jgi:DNA-3-methyladenine glycosylase II